MPTSHWMAAPALRAVLYSALLAPLAANAQTSDEIYDSIPLAQETAEVPEPATDAVSLSKIAVTGSRIKRTEYETANPILTVDRDMIERSGVTSLGDLLQDLPVAGSALGTAFNNGGTGAVEVDLRNLGSQRVLVLVNGRRWVNGLRALSTSSVDLTTIPVSIIERVDILKDGASTTYGSDAIAGVINIITRTDFDGLELRGQLGGFMAEGDGQRENLNVSWGRVLGKTSVFVDLNYANDKEVFAGDRDISKVPLFGTGNTRGSLGTPQGTFVWVPNPTATDPGVVLNECDRLDVAFGTVNGTTDSELGISLIPDSIAENPTLGQLPLCWLTLSDGATGTSQSDFRRQLAEDAYNYAPINYLITPNERTSAFAMINQPLPFGMNFTSELLYNRRVSRQVLAEMPLFTGDLLFPPYSTLYIAEDQQYNPFDQDIGRADPNSELIGFGAVLRRMTEQGVRDFNQTVDTARVGFGLNGEFDALNRYVSWELGGSWGKSKNEAVNLGLIDLDHARLALGPAADCAADPDCVPLNMFGGQGPDGTGSITQDQLDYIIYTDHSSQEQEMHNAYLNLSSELFELPAGPLGFALGFEWRKEDYLSVPDPFVQAGRSSTNQQDITRGTIDAREVFAELAIPLLESQPFAEALELSLATRYSDYDAFGSKVVGKAGLRWQPFTDLLVRGTASEAFRAPAITDLFLGAAQSFPSLVDPCDADERAQDANADTNCDADGIDSGYTQTLTQLPSDFGGNPELKPETATTFTAGIVYSPSFLPDFNVYLDWFAIEIDDFITVPGAQYILDACYRSAPDQRSFCDAVDRGDNGGINNVLNQFANFAKLETSGVDITMDYTLPFTDFGLFKLSWDTSYLIKYDQYDPAIDGGSNKSSYAGRYEGGAAVNFPRVKSNAELAWSWENMKAAWNVRYVGTVTEDCYDGFDGDLSLTALGLCSNPNADDITASKNELDATWYHDVQFTYTLARLGTDLTIGVDNLFDQDPPIGYSSFANSYDVTTYDTPGTFGYLRFVTKF